MAKTLKDTYDKKMLVEMLDKMLVIRRFEEKAGQMYGLRKIGGFCHLYIGQEAVAVGSISALNLETDYVTTGYRDHGHALACGMDPKVAMAELYGKATGCSKGKGGSMHFYDAQKHMLGGNGIVGSQIPTATGVGFKIKYKEEAGVSLCYFGDGAIHQGAFHESLNLAKIMDLPVIYICENNQYGMGTEWKRVSAVEDLSVRGVSYGIEGKQINGMDVLEVYENIKEAVDVCRKTPKPYFFEIKTYRYRGHSMSDPAKYRTKDELQSYKDQDPINILKTRMLTEKLITQKQYDEMDAQAKKIANDSAVFAEESPNPELDELYTDVLAD